MSNKGTEQNEVEAIWENKSFRIRSFKAVAVICVTTLCLGLIWYLKA